MIFTAYGKEGVKMNFIDRIFIGELTSTVMCEECANVVNDPFVDISLPIREERNQQIHDRKRVRKFSSGEEKTVVIYRKSENLEISGDSSVFANTVNTESLLNESPTDGSEKEASHSESSVDADSEASESESALQQTVLSRSPSRSCVHPDSQLPLPSASELLHSKETDSDDGMAEAISELHLSSTVTVERDFHKENQPLNVPNNLCFSEEKHMRSHSPQNAFQTLSQSYVTTSKECSIQSCLYQFTSMELLMGNNKLLCENCTEKKQKYQKETSSAGQIDWAALAQAWIAQREASGQQSMVEQPPGMMPNGQDISTMESGPNNHGNFQGDSNFNRMWQPEWGMHQQPPHPPPDQPWMPPTPGPMDIVPPSEDSNSQDSGEFAPDNRHIFNQNNHNFGGPPDNFAVGPVNQFDYQVDFILLIGNQDLQDLQHLPRIEEKGHHHSGIGSVHLLHFL
ncbi:Ubiquitin carboxyl-terminal hydrolase 45 [Tupaia chinensis]|uniref:Ubiquitin carboxyl-terminal hydrolase 45 n=1 Tax=Tupaia chinensis TaxID=246437 RepID=L8Y050_TUPCH|nr:Ubiquitin carboxyl-terminal hydrolase 45 [Tupaia chinensis]